MSAIPPSLLRTAWLTNSNWSVDVTAKPSEQTCAVTPASGTVAGANATNLVLSCTTVTVDLSPATLPNAHIGTLYSQTITASSPNGGTAPYTFIGDFRLRAYRPHLSPAGHWLAHPLSRPVTILRCEPRTATALSANVTTPWSSRSTCRRHRTTPGRDGRN